MTVVEETAGVLVNRMPEMEVSCKRGRLIDLQTAEVETEEAGVMMEEGEDRHMAKEEIETIIEVRIEMVEEDRRMRVIEVIIKRSGDN